MILHIKYMVSVRCKMIVKSALDDLGFQHGPVELGSVTTLAKLTLEERERLRKVLLPSGLELMVDKKVILAEQIKAVVIEMVHCADEWPRIKFSEYLNNKLQHDYTYMSNLFSEVTGSTVEHYIISHKIEKVKELLLYDELNLTQISYKLNYSSVAHLSNQFKKVTGISPSCFKRLENKRRYTLEEV